MPPPQVTLQSSKDVNSPTVQSTGQVAMLHSAVSERAGQGDVEIKCRLSPGGTLQVKTNSETDASMDLDDDDDHDHLYSH